MHVPPLNEQLQNVTVNLLASVGDEASLEAQLSIAEDLATRQRTLDESLDDLGNDLANLIVAAHAMHALAAKFRADGDRRATWCWSIAQLMLEKQADIFALLNIKVSKGSSVVH